MEEELHMSLDHFSYEMFLSARPLEPSVTVQLRSQQDDLEPQRLILSCHYQVSQTDYKMAAKAR